MLCGDKIYNRSADGKLMIDRSRAPRQALHSDRLAFKHPFTGEELEFHMPMPRDLASWYAKLLQSASDVTEFSGPVADVQETDEQPLDNQAAYDEEE